MSASFAPDDLDALTGLFNGRYFERALAEELASARREDRPLSLILFDIDDLKSVNDRFGHVFGDDLLAGVAHRVREVAGSADIPCRIGGDEFAVVLPDSTPEDAALVCSRLDSKLAAHPFGWAGRVKLSLGIVGLEPGEDANSLVRRADSALCRSKGTARLRPVVLTEAGPERPRFSRWEYLVEEAESVLPRLNELGAQGWELVGVVGAKLVFKRRVDESPGDMASGVREPRRPTPSADSAPVRKSLGDSGS